MALDETQRKTIYEGDGTVTQFAFSFVVFQPSDIAVYSSTDGGDTESALTFEQDYTVALNSDQDNAPGGTVTLAKAPASGTRIAILSNIPETQPMVLTTHDGFDPRVLNKSADHAVALIQQLNEKVARALSVPATSRKTSGQFCDEILNLAANAEDWANTSASSAAAAAQSAADAKTTLATIKTETDSQIKRVEESGDSQVKRIENVTDGTLANIGISCAEQIWTTTEAVAAGTEITLPKAMFYVVGRKHLRMVWNGEPLLRGTDFNEVGSSDLTSTKISLSFPLTAGDVLMAWTVPLGRGSIDELYSLIQSNSDAIADLSSKVVYKSESTTSSDSSSSSGSGT